jgi:transcriptional regulator with XRE-family HTH domain
MSRRQAAAQALISPSQWSDIERGHKQAGLGITVPVQATAETLARMAATVGVSADDLAGAGREDAARQLTELVRSHDLRRRVATIPGLGVIGKQELSGTDGQELLPLIVAVLDEISSSTVSASAKHELTSMFVDNLMHDAARRASELRLMLRIAVDAVTVP